MIKKKKKGKTSLDRQKPVIKIKADIVVGSPDAETDNILNDVFIDNGSFDALINMNNPKCIIVGRTGTGKSALIKRVSESEEHVKVIDPERMSLSFLSNSTILTYLRAEGVNLNFFYKLLWKHVFIVEIIKLYLSENEAKRTGFFQRLWESVSNGAKSDLVKKKAIDYARTWSDEFWLTTEYRIKSIESDLEAKIAAELGIEFHAVKSGTKISVAAAEKTVVDVKTKAENIISQLQANDLTTLIDLLSEEIFNNTQRKFFIVIDDLDKEWVSRQLVYDLIASMVEVIKEFQHKFKGVKVIISLRENLQMKVFSGTINRGGQREKFAPLFLDLMWTMQELKKMIDLRIQSTSNKELKLDTLFDKKNQTKTTLEYILERTFQRPRDVISFFNKIFENVIQKGPVPLLIVKQAELKYSIERLNAVEDEWSENYGEITRITNFLNGIHDGFNLRNIKDDSFAELLVEQDFITHLKGELFEACSKWKNAKSDNLNFRTFLSEILEILYRLGIIGIKRNTNTPIEYYYSELGPCSKSDFLGDVKIYVHKAFHSVLRVNRKEIGE
ncbi:MAG: putative ATPase involved in repair [Ferruginibacter sp.]|nr:putative ATPase involved in repair [Ferruginibacter sp.]